MANGRVNIDKEECFLEINRASVYQNEFCFKKVCTKWSRIEGNAGSGTAVPASWKEHANRSTFEKIVIVKEKIMPCLAHFLQKIIFLLHLVLYL